MPPALSPRALLVLGLALACWGAAPLAAQPAPCTDAGVGLVACVEGRLCACRFERGSPATGLPDGFRWDCGILRPPCGEPLPATIAPYPGLLPDSLSIEQNTNTVTGITGDGNRVRLDPGHRLPRDR